MKLYIVGSTLMHEEKKFTSYSQAVDCYDSIDLYREYFIFDGLRDYVEKYIDVYEEKGESWEFEYCALFDKFDDDDLAMLDEHVWLKTATS